MAIPCGTKARQGPMTGWVKRTDGWRSPGRPAGVILRMCLAGVAALVLCGGLVGCSLARTTEATNEGAFPQLMRDIQAAGVTILEAAEGPSDVAEKGELYLRVLADEGQDASAIADRLLSLTEKYKEQLDLRSLRVVVVSTEGAYDHTFDLTSIGTSTGGGPQTLERSAARCSWSRQVHVHAALGSPMKYASSGVRPARAL